MTENEPKIQRTFRFKWVLAPVLLLAVAGGAYWFFHSRWELPKGTLQITTLQPLAFQPLSLGAVKPKGWLLDQLRLQADGLSGHLDEFWPDVADSAWRGGKAEGWERAPYWLDGLIPLAYLTDDKRLEEKASRWMDYILKHQLSDGWLGPEQSPPPSGFTQQVFSPRDPWPQFVILKALSQYGEATGDPRVIPAIEKDLACISAQLDRRPLFDWNFFRWEDLLVTVYWLYDRTQEPWLLQLAIKVVNQGYNWPKYFTDIPVKGKSLRWNWEGHVVNNAMALKAPAVLYRLTGQDIFKRLSFRAIDELYRYHGEPNGLFSGDECLAGASPSQGTELCAIVETMFSMENSLSILGDVEFADRLEKIAYNALPAAFTPDYWCHQYVEQANQVACGYIRLPIYATVRGDANIFGLEPNFGCCTANMHQGWPKFVTHLWMKTPDGGLAAAVYGPSVVRTQIGNTPVTVELDTDYPFSEDLAFKVTAANAVSFPLYLRVPGWAEGATLKLPDGTVQSLKEGTFQKVSRNWSGNDTLVLHLPMVFRAKKGFQDSASIERGPLVYSLEIKEDWKIGRPFRVQPPGMKKNDMVVLPDSYWNYALVLDRNHPERSLTLKEMGLKGDPFTQEGAPFQVVVKGKRLDDWTTEKSAAMPPPPSPVTSNEPLEDLVLLPYGSTRLRITDFPVLK